MTRCIRWLALTSAMVATVSAGAQGAAEPPSYQLEIRLDPATSGLDCRVEIVRPQATAFSLTSDMEIGLILADGKPIAFRRDPSSSGESSEVSFDGPPPSRLLIDYSGQIRPETYPKLTSQVNMISPGLVELASYVGWYPRLRGIQSFTFRITVDAPADFVTVTNGRRATASQPRNGRSVTEWDSFGPTGSVVLVSAPGLRQSQAVAKGMAVELHSTRLPEAYVADMKTDIERAVGLLTEITGALPPTDVVRVVYSPRPGWGYVRTPLIIVSEEAAVAQSSQRFGRARDLRYVIHEIAHYWWHLADSATPEDWINEGMSEYLAFLASERLVGQEFADQLLEEYRERSETDTNDASILETANDSPVRELNRYVRPVLVLTEMRQKYGTERMADLVKALHRRFAAAHRATTAAFVEESEKCLGAEAKAFLSEALARKQWPRKQALRPYAYSPKDAVFLGAWSGPLTQAGTTQQVELRLVEHEGTLKAALANPDPAAQDIPLPELSISGDALQFRLGAFGISYTGSLAADHRTIAGEWKQGGGAYPLTLSRIDTKE